MSSNVHAKAEKVYRTVWMCRKKQVQLWIEGKENDALVLVTPLP